MPARLTFTLAMFLFAATASLAQLVNPGFESGTTGWHFWARAVDSASMQLATTNCHLGSQCMDVTSMGSQDWTLFQSGRQSVKPGELWQLNLWTRLDSLPGSAQLSFETQDSLGTVLSWSAGAKDFAKGDTGWTLQSTNLAIPKGCKYIIPRLVGYGHGHLRVDDMGFSLTDSAPVVTTPLQVANDSLRAWIDPIDLSLTMRDSITGDTVRFGGSPDLRYQSASTSGDTLQLSVRYLPGPWAMTVSMWPHGGELRIAMHADSAGTMPSDLAFPGPGATKAGQRLALPRGTGIGWPVEKDPGSNYSYRSAQFWEWQVTQGLTGATDGQRGFVVSLDQPWDARVYFDYQGSSLLQPFVFQVPSKRVWGHDRSLLIAPLRGGGWAELAKRHGARQAELGRVRTWPQKLADNPNIERMRGAMDFWVLWGGGSSLSTAFFDTLRTFGMDKAILNMYWNNGAVIDTLNAHGWLTSVYDCYSDAYPAGHAGFNSIHHDDGAVINEDGSTMNGWLAHTGSGDLQAVEVCSAFHPDMAKQSISTEQTTLHRNARFIDVEMAMTQFECWSPIHPVDRTLDASSRVATLSMVKDSFSLVTGSEQARDLSFAHVDWGEGSMSLATVADAGYVWDTPEAPQGHMDSLSMDPTYRVPLLPLASHEGFAPTWYTGDGQSKVPLRWDDKDLWNTLYATMPLLMPAGRAMWDSLRVRYLRTINLVGAIHLRCGFEAMTGFSNLSPDGKVQRTTFGNGWTVTANFDSMTRSEGSFSLPAKGFLALGASERVERNVLDGAVRSRVQLSDRWFLDPEGSLANIDGVRTSGAAFIRKLDDSTLSVAFLGEQASMDLSPATLYWPTTQLTGAGLSDLGGGWMRLTRTGAQRVYLLKGSLGTPVVASARQAPKVSPLSVTRGKGGWECRWVQGVAGTASATLLGVDGKLLARKSASFSAGAQRLDLPSAQGMAWIRVQTPEGTQVKAVGR